ncbi:MAG TPA: DUF1854 domain-containing protein [Paludibaculum sp.]|jgi:hypothetical protein
MVTFTLRMDARRRLILTDEGGQEYVDVAPVRAFPLSDPLHAISICDAEGRELVYLDSLDELDAGQRAVVEEELAQREFVPVILRIVNTPALTEPSSWRVETDRGLTTFEVESEDSVYRRAPRQVSIVDVRGIRYLIPDTQTLDAHSRRVLERFL